MLSRISKIDWLIRSDQVDADNLSKRRRSRPSLIMSVMGLLIISGIGKHAKYEKLVSSFLFNPDSWQFSNVKK